jgi:DNA polymerase
MVAMGALDMGLSEEELPGIIEKWRNASPNIVHLWWNMDAAFKQAIRRRGKSVLVNGPRPVLLLFRDDTAALSLALPSGRLLNYIRPRLGVNRFGGESFSYEGNDAGHWGRIESFGARATENTVQAIARDCLALAMLRVSQMGYNIVFHVHDEMIVEVEEEKAEKALQDMLKAMSDPIPWAKDLLLKGDGYLCNYYKKD